MLKAIDRIQIATEDAAATARGWWQLLGAEFETEDRIGAIGAKRFAYRLGRGYVDFLEPDDDDGAVAKGLQAHGRTHIFAAGVSTEDFDGLIDRLISEEAEPIQADGLAYINLSGVVGADCYVAIVPAEDRPAVGALDFHYEVTLLTREAKSVSTRLAKMFGLDESNFEPIRSDKFGYDGLLTLFDRDELHRLEVITPTDKTKTMGRFFDRAGAAYYMAFGEARQIEAIERAARKADAGITVDRPEGRDESKPPDQLWLHPSALGGVMLGISRPTMAWTWSGHPERVEAVK